MVTEETLCDHLLVPRAAPGLLFCANLKSIALGVKNPKLGQSICSVSGESVWQLSLEWEPKQRPSYGEGETGPES